MTVTVTVNGQSGSLTNGFTYVVPPTVSSVSPNSGSTAGGTAVTITGTNFAAGATVTFGSAAATNVVVVNSTTITATTPAGSAGAVTVTVTNPGVQSGSLTNGYTYVVTPTVSSVSPNNGPAAGGTAVTITGTNFAAGATVTFGGTAATNVVVVNSTTITATTPAGAGAVTVTVTVNGQSGSLTNGFTYTGTVAISFAQVASATPQSADGDGSGDLSGSTDGGRSERGGGGVERHHGDGAVGEGQCGEHVQSGDWADDRDGVATVDLLCGEHRGWEQHGDGDVQPSGGVSGCTHSGVSGSDDFGCDGRGEREQYSREQRSSDDDECERVDLWGEHGGDDDGGGGERIHVADHHVAGRRYCGRQARDDGGEQQCDGDVERFGAVGHADGDVLSGFWAGADGEQCESEQRVDGGRDGGDDHGDELRRGSDGDVWSYGGDQRGGGEQHDDYGDDAGGECGRGDGDGDRNGQSGSLASAFTYIVPPTVSSVAPSGGPPAGGTAVTITGTNFAAGATVTFGSDGSDQRGGREQHHDHGDNASGQCRCGDGNGDQQQRAEWKPDQRVYLRCAADGEQCESEQRVNGGWNGSDDHRDELCRGSDGRDFGDAQASHQRGGREQHNHHGHNSGGDAGAVTVTVTVNGQSGNLANGFTYIAPPTVSSVAPNSGSTAGGTAVTITGTNFAAGATVTFGTAAATNVAVVNSTTITATTPAGSVGAVTVTVTNSNGQSGSLTNGFTYVVPPTVSSVSPNSGTTAGGTAVTITGTNFAAGATVTFGSAAATNVVVVNSTTITATTPAGSAGAVTVTVTNVGSGRAEV